MSIRFNGSETRFQPYTLNATGKLFNECDKLSHYFVCLFIQYEHLECDEMDFYLPIAKFQSCFFFVYEE